MYGIFSSYCTLNFRTLFKKKQGKVNQIINLGKDPDKSYPGLQHWLPKAYTFASVDFSNKISIFIWKPLNLEIEMCTELRVS
jgi:hypothetical protein